MKVLFIHPNNNLTGQEFSLLERMRALRKKGIHCELLLSEHGDFAQLVEQDGFPTRFLPLNRLLKANPVPYFRTVWRISRLIKANGYKVLHCSGLYPNQYGLPAARLNRIPCVVHANASVYTAYDCSRSFVRKADFVFTVSQGVKDRLIQVGKIDERKIRTVYNGIEIVRPPDKATERKRIRQTYNLDDRHFVFAHVAELIPRKGCEYFVEAARLLNKSHPQTRFMLVGKGHDDAYERSLRDIVKRHELEKYVIFSGFQRDVLTFLQAMDTVVLASTSEGLARVLVEAQKLGLPVIGSAIPGVDEVIEHEQSGLLAKPQNAMDLAVQMERLVVDDNLRKRCIANALERSNRQFNTDQNICVVEQIYRELVK